ncbi:hypothetical protein KY290_024983 [Solanum tuberosum]|uniref:Uncharacterized protein n=1 Tax=Solanum tuberosum TaxID=4113 RepID=A0ABQ7USC5_SOLTU|nr:hypothetical protein KY290_024983 [Solanum tuberosum]
MQNWVQDALYRQFHGPWSPHGKLHGPHNHQHCMGATGNCKKMVHSPSCYTDRLASREP